MLEQECKKEEKELFGGRDRKNHGPFFACDGTVTTVFWSRMMLMSEEAAGRKKQSRKLFYQQHLDLAALMLIRALLIMLRMHCSKHVLYLTMSRVANTPSPTKKLCLVTRYLDTTMILGKF